MGYDAVRASLQAAVAAGQPARPRSVLGRFTRRVFDATVELGYNEHLRRTAGVFFPGPYLDDSRTLVLFRFHVEAFGRDGFWSRWSEDERFKCELVLAWVALQVGTGPLPPAAPTLTSTRALSRSS